MFYFQFVGYKFLSEVCGGKYEFVTFTDDDTFIDWSKLNEFMALEDTSQATTYCLKGKQIELDSAPYNGKYWLWHNLWPSGYLPPSYCNGQCAGLTPSAVEKIYTEAKQTNRNDFRLEDFYYVGILRMVFILVH